MDGHGHKSCVTAETTCMKMTWQCEEGNITCVRITGINCVVADADVMAFCDENSCPREILDVEEVHGCKVSAMHIQLP